MDNQSDDYKVVFFFCCIGFEGVNVYNSFNLILDNIYNFIVIIKEIEKYVIGYGDVNEIYECFIFNS